jgi:AraC-like DNA-binding protein
MTLKRSHPFGLPEDQFSADRREQVIPMTRPHTHNQIEINYFLGGRARYIFNAQSIDVVAGDFVFFWGAIPHQVIEADADTRFACLYVPLEKFMFSSLSAELKAAILSGGFIRVDERLELDRMLLIQARSELLGGNSVLSELNYNHIELRLRRADTTGWTNVVSSTTSGRTTIGKGHRKVVEMTRFISENAESGITATDVAAAVSLHPKYAMSLFRTSLGMTITQYLVRLKLVTAQNLLVAGEKSATTVAYESGFGSVSRFYDAFHRQVGISPREFRDLYAGNRGG